MSKEWRIILKDGLTIIIGCCLIAIALDTFIVPNQIAPGGVSGLAVVLASRTHLKIGVLSLLLNLPLLIIAWKVLGIRTLSRILVATVTITFAIDGLELVLPTYTTNILLAAVLGGVFFGSGLGILFLRGISTGGTDLLSMLLLRPFPNLPIGKVLLALDVTVVIIAVIVFHNIEVAMYSIVVLFVESKTVDSIMNGMNYAKVIYIITTKEDEMRNMLNSRSHRGTTALPARGGYTGQQKTVIMMVTHRNEMAQTIHMIKEIDHSAFLFVVNAAEVHGEGFKRYSPVL